MTRFSNLGQALAPFVSREREAIIDLRVQEPRVYSYGEIDDLSAAVARGLIARGLRRGDVVAVLSANRTEVLLVSFGALRAGIIAVPLNYRLPQGLIELILRDCGAKLLFCDAERQASCPGDIPVQSFDGDRNSFQSFLQPGPFEARVPESGEPSMFVYTSGSTGRPKGVVFPHLGHLWALDMRSQTRLVGQRMLVSAPLYHQNGLSWCQVMLASGGAVILLPNFTTAGYIDAASRYRATILTAIPTMIAMIARDREHLARADFSAVTSVRVGSAPSTEALLAEARVLFPNAVLSNGYGTTEGGPVCFGPHPKGIRTPSLSVGFPSPEVEVRLIRDGNRVDDEGVLQIRSPAVMLRYHNMPELTRKVMTDDGFYITGDVFRRDGDGFFYVVGRADDMFVCGGENVFPSSIEELLTQHPAVHQAAVVPLPDELKGHKPVAFLVLKAGKGATEEEIKNYALANAPAYMHPRRVWFLPELPLAGTNKIDKARLAGLAGSGGLAESGQA